MFNYLQTLWLVCYYKTDVSEKALGFMMLLSVAIIVTSENGRFLDV